MTRTLKIISKKECKTRNSNLISIINIVAYSLLLTIKHTFESKPSQYCPFTHRYFHNVTVHCYGVSLRYL